MKKRELLNLGIPAGEPLQVAIAAVREMASAGYRKAAIRDAIRRVAEAPAEPCENAHLTPLADLLQRTPPAPRFTPRDVPAPYRQWGRDLDRNAIEQMERACRLPVAVAGALMPDAHLGYGLPIGGVLAVDQAVIPYAVGVDIACRMKLSILDLPAHALRGQPDRLRNALTEETRFGVGATFRRPRAHPVLDEDWSVSPVTRRHRDRAWSQLGTSGSGNHFVEFGTVTFDTPELGLEPGTYLGLLSHSGSRGTGAAVADHYSKLAMSSHPELPKELIHLAWLQLDSDAGQEYWQAMQLMGRYAAANHACIHRHVAAHLGAKVILDVENHHNFAWIEQHGDRQVVVHRKGATPAGGGALGIIPGSMATPGFIVRGKGSAAALQSASHGAGRVMSRKQARSTFTWSQAGKVLRERDVTLLSAGLDEVPMVYKDIHEVMDSQRDLVDVIARFDPRLVRMAPAGERAED